MLDDLNILEQRNSSKDLELAVLECEQLKFKADIINRENDGRPINNIIVAGMGGSALAALVIKTWLRSEIKIPFELVSTYDLPNYAGNNTLVILSSYSGNTEEIISCFDQAKSCNAQIAIITSGGKLIDEAKFGDIAYVPLPTGFQPRMALIYQLCSLITILANFGVIAVDKLNDISNKYDWLKSEVYKWVASVPTVNNYAKQLALYSVGKTVAFYGGLLSAPVAYKWKICFNETAKNVSFWNAYPEFNHNEILGWTSHPVEKPFAIFDIVSNLENPQILKRFEISDRLLSGRRPKSTVVKLAGDTLIAQLLWGSILADFVSIYLAVLNGVDPMAIDMIERLKQELTQ